MVPSVLGVVMAACSGPSQSAPRPDVIDRCGAECAVSVENAVEVRGLPTSELGYGAVGEDGDRQWYLTDVRARLNGESGPGNSVILITALDWRGEQGDWTIVVEFVKCAVGAGPAIVEASSCVRFSTLIDLPPREVNEMQNEARQAERRDATLTVLYPVDGDLIWLQGSTSRSAG